MNGTGAHRRERSDGDDRPRSPGTHAGEHELCQPYRAEEVHLEQRFHALEGKLLDRPDLAAARVVDEDVDVSRRGRASLDARRVPELEGHPPYAFQAVGRGDGRRIA